MSWINDAIEYGFEDAEPQTEYPTLVLTEEEKAQGLNAFEALVKRNGGSLPKVALPSTVTVYSADDEIPDF